MSDETKDVNEDLETSSEESTEENLEEAGDVEKKNVPYDRFSKVIEERNQLREQAEELKRKQEELNKTLNPEPEAVDTPKEQDALSREEAILYAKGLSEEAIAKVKKIAKGEDVGLLEAVESEDFTSWQQREQAKADNQSAQLGASKSSAPHVEEGFTSAMSKDKHKEMWKKAMGK